MIVFPAMDLYNGDIVKLPRSRSAGWPRGLPGFMWST
jgi:hypothetical protein